MRTIMKQILGLMGVVWIFVACADDPLMLKGTLTDGINIRIGDHLLITSNDIETFDRTTKYFYINERLIPQLRQNQTSTLVWIYADKELVYSGELCRPNIIQSSEQKGNLPISLEYENVPENVLYFRYDYNIPDSIQEQSTFWPDATKYYKFIEVLRRTEKMREGIQCTLIKGKIENGVDLNMTVRFKNTNPIDSYFIDPKKVKDQLFEFSTIPLILYSISDSTKSYHSNLQTTLHQIGSEDHTSLLTLLKSGESIDLPIYCHDINVPAGIYRAKINYTGLNKGYDTKLNTDTTRVWTGSFQWIQNVEIEY